MEGWKGENFSSKIFCPESRTGAGGAPGDKVGLFVREDFMCFLW